MGLPLSEQWDGWRGKIATCLWGRATWGNHTVLYEDVVNERTDLLTPCLVR